MSSDALISRLLRAVPARALPVLALVLVVAAVAAAFLLPGGGEPGDGAARSPAATSAPTGAALEGTTGLPTVVAAELPTQAQETLARIDAGGPYAYDQDDSVFGNRERLLPQRERGFYREYTVITPGSDDRGARRIVAGADGVAFYTDDHYDSFREILR